MLINVPSTTSENPRPYRERGKRTSRRDHLNSLCCETLFLLCNLHIVMKEAFLLFYERNGFNFNVNGRVRWKSFYNNNNEGFLRVGRFLKNLGVFEKLRIKF